MSENLFKPGPPTPPPQITWIRFEDKKPTTKGVYLVWDEQNRRGQYMYDQTYYIDHIHILFYGRGVRRMATHYALFKEFTKEE